ncbi:MAG TPA: hypothetical protein VEL74_24740 [Thermoanaerobaculia bacterium]|nr:hypothetical protein [Thermoanaerobaculia bacterium]
MRTLLGLCATLALLTGCATGPSPRPLPGVGIPPWEMPDGAYGSQRLYRVGYSGPEGEGSFRVTLRLAAADRYQVQAVDPVGRALWSLDVTGGKGLSLNHRGRTFCAFEGSFDLSGVALGPFPLLSLPSLLLGRVPAQPAAAPNQQGNELTFNDGGGRRWTATVRDDGVVESWTLWEQGAPSVWWLRREDWAILSNRERRQVRWREVLQEPLANPPAPLEAPAAFREECGDDSGLRELAEEPEEPPG